MSTPGVQSSANSVSNNQQNIPTNNPLRLMTTLAYYHAEGRTSRFNSSSMSYEPYDLYLNNMSVGVGLSYVRAGSGLFGARGSLFFDGGSGFQRILSRGNILEQNNFNYQVGFDMEGFIGIGPQNFSVYASLGMRAGLGTFSSVSITTSLGVYISQKWFLDVALVATVTSRFIDDIDPGYSVAGPHPLVRIAYNFDVFPGRAQPQTAQPQPQPQRPRVYQLPEINEPGRIQQNEPERIQTRGDVYFEYNRSNVRIEYEEVLEQVAQYLLDHPEVTLVEVRGYADERGSDEYNLSLSAERADAVRRYLIRMFHVNPDRLLAIGHGRVRSTSGEVVAEETRALHRHVEFVVTRRR